MENILSIIIPIAGIGIVIACIFILRKCWRDIDTGEDTNKSDWSFK